MQTVYALYKQKHNTMSKDSTQQPSPAPTAVKASACSHAIDSESHTLHVPVPTSPAVDCNWIMLTSSTECPESPKKASWCLDCEVMCLDNGQAWYDPRFFFLFLFFWVRAASNLFAIAQGSMATCNNTMQYTQCNTASTIRGSTAQSYHVNNRPSRIWPLPGPSIHMAASAVPHNTITA